MGIGRVVSAAVTTVAVCGCAALAVTMARATATPQSRPDPAPSYSSTRTIPAYRVLTPASTSAGLVAQSPSSSARSSSASSAPTTSAAPSATRSAPPSSSSSPAPATSSAAAPPPSTHTTTTHPATRTSTPSAPKTTSHAPAPQRGGSLPISGYTGYATRVITVVAHSRSDTTATLQAWNKASGGGWTRYGSSVTAHIGSQGMTTSPSESKSATPMGSYSLTQAFGRYSDPGTNLHYWQTTTSDWWISQAGSLYNTHQRCSSGCHFNLGSPNEHLYYETPYYNYAVVIDYNTRNTGHVTQGAGSAFFLHVSVGTSTAGCVAIPQDKLVSIMRWLTPTAHPRILIGTA